MENKVDLTVILPVLNEEENIKEITDELVSVLKKLGKTYEVLAINTPDQDDSFEVMKNVSKKYPRVFPINMKFRGGKRVLQKGYQYMLGFILAKGNIIVHMDSDYEDDPRDLPHMIEQLDKGFDLVVGWRKNRKHKFFYRLTSKIYNLVSSLITGLKIHDKNCGFKAYTKSAAKAVKLHGMNFRGIPGLLHAKGYRVSEIPVNHRARLGGKRNFNLISRFKGGTLDFLSNLLISRSGDMPFRFWGFWGIILILVSLLSFGLYCWYIVTRMATLEGAILALAGGIILSIVGVLLILTGVIMEFILHQSPSSLDNYTILEDPKGRVVQNSNTR